MECLLCLDTKLDQSICIPVNSSQWQEININSLIDKYLWPIVSLTTASAGVCIACWEELNNFHKFYTRLEEVRCTINLHQVIVDNDPLEGAIKEQLLEEIDENIPLNDIDNENEVAFDENRIEGITGLRGEDIALQKIKSQYVLAEIDETIVMNDGNSENEVAIFNEHDNKSHYDGLVDSGNEDNIAVSEDDIPLLKIKSKIKLAATTKEATAKTCKKTNDIPSFVEEAPKRNKADYDSFLKEHFKITCDKCDLAFETFGMLAKHYTQEHNERGYVLCCATKYFYRHFLVDHIKCHLNPNYFKCTYCERAFATRRTLQLHTQLHEERKYACDICDKKYIKNCILERHKLTHMPKPEKKIPCNECGKFYASEFALHIHEKAVHQYAYARVCEICGQTLPDSFSYKQHMLKHNPNPVKCEDCGLLVTSKTTLKYHRNLKHPVEGSREYKCHICTRVSPNQRAFKAHVREVHEMGAKYQCAVCEKKFKRTDKLKSHMATVHTGTPLFKCKWCCKLFNTSSTLTHHRKKVHPAEWEEEQRKRYSGNLPPGFKAPNTRKT